MSKSSLIPKTTHKVVSPKSALPARVRQEQQRKESLGRHWSETNVYTQSHSVADGFVHDFSLTPLHIEKRTLIQAKLRIGTPNDRYEREADNVADTVMRQIENTPVRKQAPTVSAISRNFIQRQAREHLEEEEFAVSDDDELEQMVRQKEAEVFFPILESMPTRDADELGEEEEILIQPKSQISAPGHDTPVMSHDIQSLKGSGNPLPDSERAFFEPRFASDFSQVRVHTDHRAAHLAQSIHARAFTSGHHIVFGASQYSPGDYFGRKLIAHELAHVVQQRGAQGPPAVQCQRGQTTRSKTVSRAVAQQAIEVYLQRALTAQKKKNPRRTTLAITKAVKNALSSLFAGDVTRLLKLDQLLSSAALLRGPSQLARQVAGLLPPTVDRSVVENLARLPVAATQTRLERIKSILKPKLRLTSPSERARPWLGPTSLERTERGMEHVRKQQGLPTAKTYGPLSVDVLAAVRKLREYTRKPSKPIKPVKTYPEVEKALGQIHTNALVPEEVLDAIKLSERTVKFFEDHPDAPKRRLELEAARKRTLDYAEPRLVGRYLARKMVAGDTSITLMLDSIYLKVRNRAPIYAALERIASVVYKSLGTRAARAVRIDVMFGTKSVRLIRLSR